MKEGWMDGWMDGGEEMDKKERAKYLDLWLYLPLKQP